MQDVPGIYASPFLATGKLNMALRARKVSGAFEKRTSGREHCVVFLGKALYSHSASLHPGVYGLSVSYLEMRAA